MLRAYCDITGKLRGRIKFEYCNDLLHIYGKVCGFREEGLHGFHVHSGNKLEGFCCGQGLAGHFNPFNTEHGDITDFPYKNSNGIHTKHAGDLGNIISNKYCYDCDSYCAYIDIYDEILDLETTSITNIVNRSIVIHQDEDDLGRGNNRESLINGNAGERIGFGIIKIY